MGDLTTYHRYLSPFLCACVRGWGRKKAKNPPVCAVQPPRVITATNLDASFPYNRGRGPPALHSKDEEEAEEEEEEETPLSFSPASLAAFFRNLHGSGPMPQHGQRQRRYHYRAFLTGLSVGVGLAACALAVVRRTRGVGGGGGGSGR